MIDARELRIGNLLWNPVQEIYVPVDIRMLNDIYYYNKAKKDHGWQPIPLTEQWLIDFGFENTMIGLFQIKVLSRGSINIHTNRRDIKFVELGTTGHYLFGVVDIKFVHQLQNLYFALTGEELKRKNIYY